MKLRAQAAGLPEAETDDTARSAQDDIDVVLPEAHPPAAAASPRVVKPAPRPSPIDALTLEFAGVVPGDVIERVTSAARHALERARLAATPDAVERLARERLHARAASPITRHRRR